MKSAQELREALSGLHADALALSEVIDKGGKWTEEQEAEYKALTDDGGKIAKADAELQAREDFDAKRRQIVERNATLNRIGKVAGGPVAEPDSESGSTKAKDDGRIYLRGQKSRFFADARQAKAGAEWIASTVTEGDQRRQHVDAAVKYGGEVFAAQSIGTSGKGGYLVPEPIATEIIKQRDAVAVAPQLCRTFSMGQETLRFNRETGDVTIYYPGESSAITPSDVDWTQHTLTVTKRAALIKMSREFVADSNVGALDEIVDNLRYRFAYALDNEFINGDGTSAYGGETGLIGAVNTTNRHTAGTNDDTIAELVIQDFVDTKKALPHKFQEGAAWLMKPDAWYHLESLLMAAGGAATAEFAQALSGTRTFMGKPVYLSDLFPAEAGDAYVAFYGNFREAVAMGDRNDMSIDTSTERYFDTDDVAVRGTHRYDLLVFNNEAYASLRLAS